MSLIGLNFVNKSNDINNSKVVIFQKQVNPDFNEDLIAWKVIEYCGQGDHHPFVYDNELQISASDSYGNFTPKMNASAGQCFEVKESDSGHVLVYKGASTNPSEVQVINSLTAGSIKVNCFRSGKLLSTKKNVVPSEEAVFQFLPHIYIGTLSDVVEGQSMNSAIVSSVNTELSLLGVDSSDIVMRGGGYGRTATAYTFDLENRVMA